MSSAATIRIVFVRTVWSTAIGVAVSGCVRTYDGSIVPTYETAIVRVGPVPLLGLRKSQVAPGNSAYVFPSAPRPTYAPAADRQPRATRVRNRSRVAASAPAREPAPTVRCRDAVSDGGRVKVVCD